MKPIIKVDIFEKSSKSFSKKSLGVTEYYEIIGKKIMVDFFVVS
jgi:hypothetical protein